MHKRNITTEITVAQNKIGVTRVGEVDYLSLTDIAKYDNQDHPADVIKNWFRSKDTIEFLGFWEKINNPNFKLVEFDQFANQAGRNRFVMSPRNCQN